MAAVFALMPWPKHFSLKTFGLSYPLIFPLTAGLQKADGRMTGPP